MKVLIYGAGVIGSLYAALFSRAGVDTAVYARGRRLAELREKGLLYRSGGGIARAQVRILGAVDPAEEFDFIFLTVRENQLLPALEELRQQGSGTIVTMVNTLTPYRELEKYCGAGRLLPAFPGAGGGIAQGVLDAALTPRLVQPTTFGELSGENTPRAKRLAALLRRSGIPWQRVKNMHFWQLSHLAMVVPIADAYYLRPGKAESGPDYSGECRKTVGEDAAAMRRTAAEIRGNFRALARRGMLSPAKFHLLAPLPVGLLAWILQRVYASEFGDRFMYRHAAKAPDEMAQLHEEFYRYMAKK